MKGDSALGLAAFPQIRVARSSMRPGRYWSESSRTTLSVVTSILNNSIFSRNTLESWLADEATSWAAPPPRRRSRNNWFASTSTEVASAKVRLPSAQQTPSSVGRLVGRLVVQLKHRRSSRRRSVESSCWLSAAAAAVVLGPATVSTPQQGAIRATHLFPRVTG